MSNVFFITGCSRGMGLEVAKEALKEVDSVVIGVSRSEPRENLLPLAREHKSSWIWIQADLALEMERIRVVSEIKKRNLQVSHVLHNAAALRKILFEKVTFDDFQYLFNINFWAPFHLTQLLLPVLKPKAHVVFMSSMGGFQGSMKYPGMSLYTATKAAIANLAESLSVELKLRDVRVNALCPGAVDTDMLREAFPHYKAPVSASEMAQFIYAFLIHAPRVMNGKVIPIALNDPSNE